MHWSIFQRREALREIGTSRGARLIKKLTKKLKMMEIIQQKWFYM